MNIENIDLKKMASFGIAGNFAGHLEQAGEAENFTNFQTAKNAPKTIFPTYIPFKNKAIPQFLSDFPFSSEKIEFPKNEKNLQIEPECALICKLEYKEKKIATINPLYFGASNDCSIRKEGKVFISTKKNWGKNSKGFSCQLIKIDRFEEGGILDDYRIASFLQRNNELFEYGEDCAVKTYSYFYKKLIDWCIEKFNTQKENVLEENILSYLENANFPEYIMLSVGATRYTDFGMNNYLMANDTAIIILYPQSKYDKKSILEMIKNNDFQKNDISVLKQKVIL